MHLGLDVREACKPKRTGKGQWTYGLLEELLRREHQLTLFVDTELPPELKRLVVSHRTPVRTVITPQQGFAWHRAVASQLRANKTLDAYLSPTSYIVPALAGKKMKCVPVVHDLIAFRGEPHDKRAQWIERFTLRRAMKLAYRVCTVSEATKADLLARYPSLDATKVHAIFAGVAKTAAEPAKPDSKTIVCLGTLCPRKNQLSLIKAFDALPGSLQAKLVLIGGRGWDDEPIVHAAKMTSGVTWKGYVEAEELSTILSTATVLALPSHYEGFGLPLLEAMRAGIPVLTADRGSLREVAGDAAVYVDPSRVESIRDGLQSLLTDEKLRKELIAKGRERLKRFSWERTVDLLIEAIH